MGGVRSGCILPEGGVNWLMSGGLDPFRESEISSMQFWTPENVAPYAVSGMKEVSEIKDIRIPVCSEEALEPERICLSLSILTLISRNTCTLLKSLSS